MSDYVSPASVVESMSDSGYSKTTVPAWQLVLRGFLATYLLGAATTIAVMAEVQTGVGIFGALLFPLGLTLVMLFGFELVTGAFGIVPIAVMEKRTTVTQCLLVFWWLIVGHLIGGLASAAMIAGVLNGVGSGSDPATAQGLVDLAVSKSLDYQEAGVISGLSLATLSAILCNWLVVLGVLMSMASTSTPGKILGIWMPIFAFYALGYEHAVVNFFVLPAGMMLGAPISVGDWWIWNQIPSLVGNFIGGFTLAALGLYYSHFTRMRTREEINA